LAWFTQHMGRHGHDRIVVGFTTTYAISSYHKFRLGEVYSLQHYVIQSQ